MYACFNVAMVWNQFWRSIIFGWIDMKLYMKILLRNLSHPIVIRYMYTYIKGEKIIWVLLLRECVALSFGFLCLPTHYGITGCRVFKVGWGDTNLEKVFSRDHHTQRKLLNFENWFNGGLRIRVLKVNYFHLLRKKYLKLKSWLIFNAIIVIY